MESVVGTVVVIALGLCIVAMGAWQVKTGDPRLLHSYHYATTPVAELPALARETGAGLISTGAGCVALGASFMLPLVMPLGLILLLGGIAFMLYAIVRHNGGLFTGGEAGYLASMGLGKRLLIFGAIGLVIAAAVAGPGIYMGMTGDVSMLHSYHYEGVAAADLPRFAWAEGLSLVGLGLSIFLCALGGAGLTGRQRPTWALALTAVGALLFCASLTALLLFIPYFGGSLNP